MHFELTQQQRLFEASLADWYGREGKSPSRQGAQRWQAFAELGWLGLPFEESDGGLGCDALDTGLLMHALGEHLETLPYAASIVVAGALLAELGSQAQREALLPALIEGRVRLALAHSEPGLDWPWAARALRAERSAQGWRLHGLKQMVEDAHEATHWLVSASCEDASPRLFLMEARSDMAQQRYRTLGGSQACDLQFDALDLPVNAMLGEEGDALHTDALARAIARGMVAQSWAATGVQAMLVKQTARYVSERQQFGRPLAEFQAVRHQLAQMQVAQAQARASCELAALQCASAPDLLAVAAATRIAVGRASESVANQAIQLHGAMGVCDELPVAPAFRWLAAYQAQGGHVSRHEAFLGARQLQAQTFARSAVLEAQA